MPEEALQSLLGDEKNVQTLLAVLSKKTPAESADRTAVLCMLTRCLPPREQKLAERLIYALLLMTLLEQSKNDG